MMMQIARTIAATINAAEESRRTSAKIIPIAAMSASPTNGWRGAFSNFIHRLFAYPALARQAAIAAIIEISKVRENAQRSYWIPNCLN